MSALRQPLATPGSARALVRGRQGVRFGLFHTLAAVEWVASLAEPVP